MKLPVYEVVQKQDEVERKRIITDINDVEKFPENEAMNYFE